MKQDLRDQFESFGDAHQMTSIETPIRKDAFLKTDHQKIEAIQEYFHKIMVELGLDMEDDSLKGTPYRVAKMYVKEMFAGLNPNNKPELSVFDNKYEYKKMLIESDIMLNSACEHHFLPIIGKAHVGYVSSGKVIGLSKINRIVDYYARRPQVQERLSLQIFNELQSVLQTNNVIVIVEAEHTCISTRGVNDKTSKTTTIEYSGVFEEADVRNDFYKMLTPK
ncbi:MAG: GTP cyclohydrolase I FolE [Balneolaceae bacterium]|nr:GTP cyclohydrolase I FolE [Balneolaceae bacterium]